MTRPTGDDLVVLAASLAGVVVGCTAVAWAAWGLLRRGVCV